MISEEQGRDSMKTRDKAQQDDWKLLERLGQAPQEIKAADGALADFMRKHDRLDVFQVDVFQVDFFQFDFLEPYRWPGD
jgi:hypothetical protein